MNRLSVEKKGPSANRARCRHQYNNNCGELDTTLPIRQRHTASELEVLRADVQRMAGVAWRLWEDSGRTDELAASVALRLYRMFFATSQNLAEVEFSTVFESAMRGGHRD